MQRENSAIVPTPSTSRRVQLRKLKQATTLSVKVEVVEEGMCVFLIDEMYIKVPAEIPTSQEAVDGSDDTDLSAGDLTEYDRDSDKSTEGDSEGESVDEGSLSAFFASSSPSLGSRQGLALKLREALMEGDGEGSERTRETHGK